MRREKIKKRVEEIQAELGLINLIAVSKYYPFSDIEIAYSLGLKSFGESRVSELQEKAEQSKALKMDDLMWHFIGHLQTNKVNALLKIPNLSYIHSVDSIKLLKELIKKEHLLGSLKVGLFLEVNTSGEQQKHGVLSLEELKQMIDFFMSSSSRSFYIAGLMTMSSIRASDFISSTKECFQKLVDIKKILEELYPQVCLKLSMGMSEDYVIAKEYQTDFVRIGSKIFED